ncbi:putative sulfoacetate transporter SauU [Pandoraea apista]|uniref:Putative sulfoacetate transporter SauU n=1 Tax=Pandoraea apista TaxID=93218 RepID=A0A5E5P4R9_9BURK|nr:hypothetical protein LMG16407_00413 [Pandoraea apista]VVG71716.1 putative sulfoacetate transporter SauU [Pandoraea apista]
MVTHRTVRQIQFICGPRKTTMASGCFKRAQCLEGRKVLEHDVKFYSQYARKGFVGVIAGFGRQSIPKQFTRV